MNEFISFAVETLVPASRAVLLPAFAGLLTGGELNVDAKNDGSPASDADRDAERHLRQLIEDRYPAHGIVGEEFGSRQPDAEFVWVLDPLDGTREFLAQQTGWGTLIGLLRHGRAIAGLIDEPLRGITHLGSVSTEQSSPTTLAKATIACTGPETMFRDTDWEDGASRLLAAVTAVEPHLNCLGFARAAEGVVDLAVENDLKLHDIVALLPILWQAGATCRMLNGGNYREYVFDPTVTGETFGLVAGLNAQLVDDAVKMLRAS